jgi:hypothetical protein
MKCFPTTLHKLRFVIAQVQRKTPLEEGFSLIYMYPTAFHFQAASVAMTNLLESHYIRTSKQGRLLPAVGSHD